MRNVFNYCLVTMMAMLALSSGVALAQGNPAGGVAQNPPNKFKLSEDTPGGPAPVHDMSGTYVGPTESKLNNEIPPLTPAGQARFKLNIPDPFSAQSNDPWGTCDPFGMPRSANNETRGIAFAQMPGRIIILNQYEKVWREIWMDGRPLPQNVGHKEGPDPRWYGYSAGHWDGDNTLVIDTVGMDTKSWVDRRGYPHTVDARVTERYTRPDHNHINLTETLDDPAFYTKSFIVTTNQFKWIPGQDDAKAGAIPFAEEQLCVPSEAIEYMKFVGLPADEDQATGKKKK